MNGLGTISARRRVAERMGRAVLGGTAFLALAALAWLLGMIVVKAWPGMDLRFLTSFMASQPARAGILPAILGTLWLGGLSMLFAIPVGVAAAVYLNEFAPSNRVTSFLRASIANLAGVPSVVFGILGLALFVRYMELGPSLLAAAMTLGLLTLPIVIVVSEESLKSVPQSIREAAFGLGASRWQVVRHHVLPYSLPGTLTGSILALARTMGETAPLILIGAAAYVPFLPSDPGDRFTALPIQAYRWALHSNAGFHTLAWGAVLVLIVLVLAGNLTAILLRDRFQRRYRW
ncbi:MAG TPA: phosphate ABC transporter permease PstA [Candidatus Thermoplasmatota archaeon]|nr:phosphate ABC transporter permease PstA [Candidatus Thermoplasmatota archaeon]